MRHKSTVDAFESRGQGARTDRHKRRRERVSGPEDSPISFLLGQRGETPVACAGFISEHPETGADIAHLVVYPTGAGVADKMRTLAESLGLSMAMNNNMPQIPADRCWAAITDTPPAGWELWLHYRDTAILHRPIDQLWRDTLADQQQLVVWIGQDPFQGRPTIPAQDKYLSRTHRTWTGLIRVLD